jgi:hypothetical protein
MTLAAAAMTLPQSLLAAKHGIQDDCDMNRLSEGLSLTFPPCSLSTAYYGSNALGLLGSDKAIDSAVLCPLAEEELEKDSLDLKLASLAAHVLKSARCGHASRASVLLLV